MPPAARLGEKTNHPGTIAGAVVTSVFLDGRPAAVRGSTHICALPPKAGPHPPNPIVGGSRSVFIGGRAAARLGDRCACGAHVVSGTSKVFIGG
jgi:uncharacterized Zn-binding protein involved in type VI secretion